MTILRRAYFHETLQTFIAVFAILLLIIVSNQAVDYLGEAAAGKLVPNLVLGLIILKILIALKLILPLCLYLALILTIGRLRRDLELTAIVSAGVGRPFFYTVTAQLSAFFAIIVALLAFTISPWAETKIRALEAQGQEDANIYGIIPGRFREMSKGNRVLFVEEVSEKDENMRNVFLRVNENGQHGVLSADRARVMYAPEYRDRYVVFNDGHRYDGIPGKADFSIIGFKTYAVRLDSASDFEPNPAAMSPVPTADLLQSPGPYQLAELHWRFAMPLGTILLALLAVVLARAPFATGRYNTIAIGVLLYFTYSNTLGIVKSLTKRGDIPTEIGLWPVHIVLLALVLTIELYPQYLQRFRRKKA